MAAAHEVRPVILTLTLQPERAAELQVSLDLEALLSGLAAGETHETNPGYEELRVLGPDALEQRARAGSSTLPSRFEVRFDDATVPMVLRAIEIPAVGDKSISRISTLGMEAAIPLRAGRVSVRAHESIGANVVRVIDSRANRILFAGLLQPGQPTPNIDISGREPAKLEFLRYIVLGFTHIVPEGLDHILFVVGLFLLNGRIRSLLWQVSAFTLAHTITLALGIYGVVRLSPSVVEPLIAASIAFVAVENLATDRLSRWRPVLVFVFGLVHGLGFAGVLEEIGLPKDRFIAALLGFNIGVEFGQLAVLGGCFLAVGFWFRNRGWYRTAITQPASAVIAAIAAYWFFERLA